MELISDNFISYDEGFDVKQEKLSDHGIPLSSPRSVASESTSICTISIPPTLQNFLNSTDTLTTETTRYENQTPSKKRGPFQIIKTKREEPAETIHLKIEDEERLLNRSKRILKRAKAKQRNQFKQQESVALSSPTSSRYASDTFTTDSNIDDKTKKKIVQMIRNRISAQNSRDRKKAYVVQLEHSKNKLAEDNSKLSHEKAQLLKEIKKLQDLQKKLLKENKIMKENHKLTCDVCTKSTVENQIEKDKSILLAKNIEKELSQLSNFIGSKTPDFNKSSLNQIFALSALLSSALLKNMSTKKASSLESLSTEEAMKLVIENLGQLCSNGNTLSQISSLSDITNILNLLQTDNLLNQQSDSTFQVQGGLSGTSYQTPSADLIKVEEGEPTIMIGNRYFEPSPKCCDKENMGLKWPAVGHSSSFEDHNISLFSPNMFKNFFEEDFKTMHCEHDNMNLNDFKDVHLVENPDFLQFFESKQQMDKESKDVLEDNKLNTFGDEQGGVVGKGMLELMCKMFLNSNRVPSVSK